MSQPIDQCHLVFGVELRERYLACISRDHDEMIQTPSHHRCTLFQFSKDFVDDRIIRSRRQFGFGGNHEAGECGQHEPLGVREAPVGADEVSRGTGHRATWYAFALAVQTADSECT